MLAGIAAAIHRWIAQNLYAIVPLFLAFDLPAQFARKRVLADDGGVVDGQTDA